MHCDVEDRRLKLLGLGSKGLRQMPNTLLDALGLVTGMKVQKLWLAQQVGVKQVALGDRYHVLFSLAPVLNQRQENYHLMVTGFLFEMMTTFWK